MPVLLPVFVTSVLLRNMINGLKKGFKDCLIDFFNPFLKNPHMIVHDGFYPDLGTFIPPIVSHYQLFKSNTDPVPDARVKN